MSVVTVEAIDAQATSNPLVEDALVRAKALASSGSPFSTKRPSDDFSDEGPFVKKQYQPIVGMNDMNMIASSLGVTTEQILVPDSMVGLIIGRGGEQITRLQAESSCKIQMSQDSQGMPHRLCTLTGTVDSIAAARSMIEGIISREGNRGIMSGNCSGVGSAEGIVGNGISYDMMVPGRLVARIIGKGGEVIKALQEETGAKIVIIQDSKDYAEEKPLKITGSPEVVENARRRVEQFIAEEEHKMSRDIRNRAGFGGYRGDVKGLGCMDQNVSQSYDSGYDIVETMTIPTSKVGLVMGKGGETIRMICNESGAHCQVDKSAPDGVREKSIVIKGRSEAVSKARDMINEKIGTSNFEGGSRGIVYGSANGYGNCGGGQPDYSAQWAEYYRSLGMVKEAEIIEHQSQARATTVQPQQLNDYSVQWAQYYRSVGKYKEADAIEEQMRSKAAVQRQLGAPGQPLPYGGNSCGQQSHFM